MRRNRIGFLILIVTVSFILQGCNFLLKIVHKEMAEEKKMLGNTLEYNPKVEEIQVILKEIGYNVGRIDGKLGTNTRAAVEAFQKDYGLKVSGYIDKKTWKELDMIYSANVIYLSKVDLKQVQTALKNAGFDPGPVDGKKGAKTDQAIRSFQAAHGFKVDGIVGRETWNRLRRFLFKRIE